MTSILVDMTGAVAKKLQDSVNMNKGPVGWTFTELVAESTEYLPEQGGMQRWKIEDEGASPELEGKRIEPVFGSQT